jgi:hypothetical protein
VGKADSVCGAVSVGASVTKAGIVTSIWISLWLALRLWSR